MQYRQEPEQKDYHEELQVQKNDFFWIVCGPRVDRETEPGIRIRTTAFLTVEIILHLLRFPMDILTNNKEIILI
jgi:hypothetical protein